MRAITRPNRPIGATCSSCTVGAPPSPCLRGHRRAISLTTIFDEHYPSLCNMASRADERIMLDTTYSHCMVRTHLRQDQLSATGNTTHHSHPKPHAEAPTRARGV